MAQNWVLAGLIMTTALAAVLIVQLVQRILRRRQRNAEAEAAIARQTVFLFEGERLLDATPAARDLLSLLPEAEDWPRLLAYLGPRFPQAMSDLTAPVVAVGAHSFIGTEASGCGRLRLEVERMEGRLRLALTPVEAAEGRGLQDAALAHEVSQLRAVAETAPMLAWREDAAGQVLWANAAYRQRACRDAGDGAHPWPLPALFAPGPGLARAQAQGAAGEAEGWFDLFDAPAGDHLLRFAVPADAAVRAEGQLREFVQTLSRTFADLPIGLAVFDRQRRLQVFNPALTDLTTLGVSFLSARPSFEDVLDRLREARMIPEPKDYRSWRQHMVALEAAASAGYHAETWSLPGGQTYRVTGRPHPGGAIGFVIEDITTGVALTRKFRAEIDLGREVLDRLDQPLCVLSRDGALMMTNAACRALAGEVAGEDARWHQLLADPGDAGAAQLQTAMAGHAGWAGRLTLANGAVADAVVTPMSGGLSLLRFVAPVAPTPALGSAARAARDLAAASRRLPRQARAEASSATVAGPLVLGPAVSGPVAPAPALPAPAVSAAAAPPEALAAVN